jgi:hypothetical protein
VEADHEAVEAEAEDVAHCQESPFRHRQLLQKHHRLQVGAVVEGEEVDHEAEVAEAAGSLLLKASRSTRLALTATAT